MMDRFRGMLILDKSYKVNMYISRLFLVMFVSVREIIFQLGNN